MTTYATFCDHVSKQRVIDRFVVGYGAEYVFPLSVIPYTLASGELDITVVVNGVQVYNYPTPVMVNTRYCVDLTTYLTQLLQTQQAVPPVVEIHTFTIDTLLYSSPGYYEIPQQLEANPNQLEVGEINGSDLFQHFTSIIQNQSTFSGTAFGGINNYKDTDKDISVGNCILQNTAPMLKTMLVSSDNNLDIIQAIRFSSDEYTKFKNKYIKTALQLINQEFSPVQYYNNEIVLNGWVEQILKTINLSREYSNAFAYSYMIANGPPMATETQIVPATGNTITLTNYIDLTDDANALYIYDTTINENLLLLDIDYTIVSTNLAIEIKFNSTINPGDTVYCAFFTNPSVPAYLPSTPSKIGTASVYIPKMVLDTSYAIPANVIIGHDGSRTVAYNDYRDNLLLELEKRIYNLIQSKFRNEYALPLRIESVRPGFFRTTRYSREEYLDITESYLNRWAAKNKANYKINDWSNLITLPNMPVSEYWKLYNYTNAITTYDCPLHLPGNWKGIFEYCYDTIRPNTCPWEMLGFSSQPSWWITQYGAPITNSQGELAWPASNLALWQDIEQGIIRQGPTAIYDPVTLQPMSQPIWTRAGLSGYMPVDNSGDIRSVIDIFHVSVTGDPTEPFDGFDNDWVYGDGAPVEAAWKSTSGYVFSVQEFLYLMRPGPFGELFWDTLGTDISTGMINDITLLPNIELPVMSSTHRQYVQNDLYASTNTDSLFSWMRPKNTDQFVHAENVNGAIQVRYGYQRWISDNILFSGNNITTTFGQKVRTLDVNLGNKFAGFTNKDTVTMYMQSVTPNATTTNLAVPSTDFDVMLYTGQPVKTYSYSGIIVRTLANGKFTVYGYDLLNSEFSVLDRSNEELINISVGGTPAGFTPYSQGSTYYPGNIVRYNGVYYMSLGTIEAGPFDSSAWQKLNALPVTGGITVTYRPISDPDVIKIPYGTVLDSVQDVFDVIIGWGAYLESQGWVFDDVNTTTNQVSDWLYVAKQFIFWLNGNWSPDSYIQLSPSANKAKLTVSRGYPADVETMSNGVYSILDKYGIAIPSKNIITERTNQTITISPANLASGGIYYLQVNATETEHILMFDNVTSFSDIIYEPLLRSRQSKLKYYGFRTNSWYGKMEAPGYLIINNQLIPNYDSIVEAMRYYYDPNVIVDNSSLEDLSRSLIGFETKPYFDNMEITDDVQYMFYKGSIRQKGTVQALDNLFRSTIVQNSDTIDIYEEWAIKTGVFGNIKEEISTEFILQPEQNSGQSVVARMNFVPAQDGYVSAVEIINAQNVYTSVPKIVIDLPDYAPNGWTPYMPGRTYIVGSIVCYNDSYGNPVYYSSNVIQTPSLSDPAPSASSITWTIVYATRRAKAYAVLGTNGIISRIDITDPGAGYTSNPHVYIDSGSTPHNLDRLNSIWHGNVVADTSLDNIVDIDINDNTKWVRRPENPAYSSEFPTTSNIEYTLPNAGYVNINDVTWTSFNVDQLFTSWGTTALNPTTFDTVWIANNFMNDWNVYKLVPMEGLDTPVPWTIISDATSSNNLLLAVDTSITLNDQLASSSVNQTDLGNVICLQFSQYGAVASADNHVVTFTPNGTYTDPNTNITYNSYNLLSESGVQLTSSDIGDYASLNTFLLLRKMRFTEIPQHLPVYVGLSDIIWIDSVDTLWTAYKISANPGLWDSNQWDVNVLEYWGVPTLPLALPPTVTPPMPQYAYGWDVTGPLLQNKYRQQTPMINTSLFESAEIFQQQTQLKLVSLPVYDPFKNILPAAAKQNITYISDQDPARYNVAGNAALLTQNITFAKNQVGMLWWDTSTAAYMYYEQPMAVDGSETPTQNLAYIRDNWGKLFPGSVISIYEWTSSPVPPASYKGTGTPRSTTEYVQLTSSDIFTNVATTSYYFWVKNQTSQPTLENRTMTGQGVASMLTNPQSQNYAFFAPIQQTSINNSCLFYNVQNILSYQGNHIQVTYKLNSNADQQHIQWAFYREGDNQSTIPTSLWGKMVDSLCGYTDYISVSNEWSDPILIADDLPWDMYGWDISMWDDATSATTPVYGDILQVPDPRLGSQEAYGINYRPLQSMFVNLSSARQVFVIAANNLLKYIPTRDNNNGWADAVPVNPYWTYTNYYLQGYENVTPTAVYATLAAANADLIAGALTTVDIVQVFAGTTDGRYVLYAVEQVSESSPVLSFVRVGIQNSAIQLTDNIYTDTNLFALSLELRYLLNEIEERIFVDDYHVNTNMLFFSMLNYVMSEQKTPDWVFKSSYIYIKENNIPLSQNVYYVPDQIENIMDYINDNKPYHTKIRDYTSVYVTTDIADGTVMDTINQSITLTFGPNNGGPYMPGTWDKNELLEHKFMPWGSTSWDVNPADIGLVIDSGLIHNPGVWDINYPNSTESEYWDENGTVEVPWDMNVAGIQQIVSGVDSSATSPVLTIPLTTPDPTKIGYSALYPYTFSMSNITANNPQSFITPVNIISVQMGTSTLIYGKDYYAEYNSADDTYTVYFYAAPTTGITPVATILLDASRMVRFNYNTHRTEVAYGYPTDNLVINVDTKLPVNVNGGIYPIAEMPSDNVIQTLITAAGGTASYDPTIPVVVGYLPATISYKENVGIHHNAIIRNSNSYQGTLLDIVTSPSVETLNIDVITIVTSSDILPVPGVVWIDGERIEYQQKTANVTTANAWDLRLVRRGTNGTSPTLHNAGALVFIEENNTLPASSITDIWLTSVNASTVVFTEPLTKVDGTIIGYMVSNTPAPINTADIIYMPLYNISGDIIGYSISSIPAEFVSSEFVDLVSVTSLDLGYIGLANGPLIYYTTVNGSAGGLWYSSSVDAEYFRSSIGSAIV